MENRKPIREKIVSLFRPSRNIDPEALKGEFRSRYGSFRSLLTANNNALELMAEMEHVFSQGQPFGMAFVRGHCTAVSVNVYKMIQNLLVISGGKYGGLQEAFDNITAGMEQVLARRPAIPEGDPVMDLSKVGKEDADLAGDKMANLGEVLNRVGYRVPDGFVITAAATRSFMAATGLQDEINRLLKTLDMEDLESLYSTSARIQQLITAAPVPDELARSIREHYERLAKRTGGRPQISMRSSAVEEDRSGVSFAGQYRTQLNISEDLILQTYKEIVASKYRSQAIVYRHQRGFRHQDVVMCVGCLVMVDARTSGVIFSRSPRDPHSPWLEINAARGLASRVVEGSVDTDFYRVARSQPHEVIEQDTGGREPVLDSRLLGELTGAALKLENHFGVPQDIEWSVDAGGDIVILQTRPLARADNPVEGEVESAACKEGTILAGGLTASAGAACGPVFRVRTNVDLLEFPAGSVLVVEHPLPEWASLLSRAVAVISETGHAATHLAIVAREFGRPALFGQEGAMKKLGNGDVVTVDGSGRCVYGGRREELLMSVEAPPNLMAGSPVYMILDEIMKLVVPLNLTDPGSPYFAPSRCRTLHDLTRFCHEKAVSEMFSFGEEAGYYARSAKQLVGKTPFQWWVIDLDDGLRPGFDAHEKYVSVDDIVSEPMLAIWDGMTAKPWEGPPPVSVKGFGSILFRSTMNPSLDPSVRASLGTKNYFLISRNFCNLNMRLGYHFTMVEAHLGPHVTENYVSFQFKGGAADRSRRFIRVFLLRDVLEKFGFRVEVKHDALAARIEKKEKGQLLEGLKILGYLLIHTRQIDMVMGEQVMVDRYRRKIMDDLSGIVDSAKGEMTDAKHQGTAG